MNTVTANPQEVDLAYRAAMRRFASTVTIITAADHERHHGMTATAVTSLSMNPPSLLICLNQKTLLHDIMYRARRFCVNVLHRDQVALSAAFSGGAGSEERFEMGEPLPGRRAGQPVLQKRRRHSLWYAHDFCR
jgi:flavin reductase (DIM6/NTAB) family NADH-FMN oxidoreductase RutF